MLVLTRKLGESIKIAENIEVTIVAIKGDQIKIGINAPKEIEIHRKEIFEEIQSENTEASKKVDHLFDIILKTKKNKK